jgi:hypothetical protein
VQARKGKPWPEANACSRRTPEQSSHVHEVGDLRIGMGFFPASMFTQTFTRRAPNVHNLLPTAEPPLPVRPHLLSLHSAACRSATAFLFRKQEWRNPAATTRERNRRQNVDRTVLRFHLEDERSEGRLHFHRDTASKGRKGHWGFWNAGVTPCGVRASAQAPACPGHRTARNHGQSLFPMHAGARKGRKANRYVVSTAFVGRGVAHLFARLYVEPLASLDIQAPVGVFDA